MRTNVETGRAGELAAARFLIAQGYRILERNVRFRTGEIDIVAREGGALVFVEVKTRTGSRFGAPAEAVTRAKQQQLVRLAQLYLTGHGPADQSCRFDVVAVEPASRGGWTCTLFQNAFSAG
ncbi:MAG TPA: YraN family protein [Symbiobacteriaceae bacterium]|jgi:putative endonuclease